MNVKKLTTGVFLICVSTLMVSCASTKKSGCYFSDEAVKELPIEKKKAKKTYTIAE